MALASALPPSFPRRSQGFSLLEVLVAFIIVALVVTALFRLFGGGVFGDLAGLPSSQLAVLPGTTHVGVIDRAEWLVPMIRAFLDAPMPEDQ